MSYNVYVTRLTNVRPHPNADRLQLGECFGNTVCVNLDFINDMVGVYFPTDGQISVEFGETNNLFRKKDENGKEIGGFIDARKRNVQCIRLRGERSDGLFLPLSCLDSFGDTSKLKEGDIVTVFNGHEIACKYIPRSNHHSNGSGAHNKTKKKKAKQVIAPLFQEHKDTEQLAYNLDAFEEDDLIEVTLKMHGTSGRTAYLPCFKGHKRTWKDKLLRREGIPVYEYDYVTGTRRVVLENFDGGFYGNDEFRRKHSETFKGKLYKGETVYYEIVGFLENGQPIMPIADNKKLKDKDFLKLYGEQTTYSYGCAPGTSDIYVYRMTMTNEDGDVVEYSSDFMRYRCEQMGVKSVPVFWRGYIKQENYKFVSINVDNYEPTGTPGEYVRFLAESFYDGVDPVGKTHVREGVVVRVVNKPIFTAYKHKNWSFKCLEGIVKVNADAPDMEEAQELESE